MARQLGQPLMVGKGKQENYNVSLHEHPCSADSNMVWLYMTQHSLFLIFFFLLWRISLALLPTCRPQSERLLSQSFQAYWCVKFIYFTPPLRLHLKSVAIQL